ncbi:putative DNA-binding protein [Micrococcus sp. TA1]|nr:putative DNA-binding protein [Micrococcus sp. TA1]
MPTPLRNIRIPDELWQQLIAKAKEQDTDASTIIRQLITQWLETQKE